MLDQPSIVAFITRGDSPQLLLSHSRYCSLLLPLLIALVLLVAPEHLLLRLLTHDI